MNLLLRQTTATNRHKLVRRSLKAISIEASPALAGVLYHPAKPLRNAPGGASNRLFFALERPNPSRIAGQIIWRHRKD